MKKSNKKPNPKKLQFELFAMEDQYGLEFKTEIECLDFAVDNSDYTKPHYFLILSGNKLLKSITVDRGCLSWTSHK